MTAVLQRLRQARAQARAGLAGLVFTMRTYAPPSPRSTNPMESITPSDCGAGWPELVRIWLLSTDAPGIRKAPCADAGWSVWL